MTIHDIHRAVVVGAGKSGRAAVRLLCSHNIPTRLLDKNPAAVPTDFADWAAQNGVEILTGDHKPEYFADADVVIPSPAAAQISLLPLLPKQNPPVIMAETELAWTELHGEKVIAVTGTSGKTTTVELISAMLRRQGKNVFTGGNIGTPLSEYILNRNNGGERADVVVLELSSFQLQTCHSFRPDIGILLNISENHLDFHKDMQEYTDAKMNMFLRQMSDDIAIFPKPLEHLAKEYRIASRVITFEPEVSRFTDTKLLGPHNRSNAEVAFLAASHMGVTEENAKSAVAEFTPIANRLERVAEKNGILFVNDSKATTIEALKVALSAFDRPILLLVGGKFKGGDLEGIKPLLRQKVRHLALFGGSREHFEPAWSSVVPTTYDTTLEAAVHRLYDGIAKHGDVILLSPATSSFDQYDNYVARGNDFKRIVQGITE